MKHMCKICSNEYDYCHSCAITKNVFKNAGYCDENCYHMSMILQEYVSKSITAAETLNKLKAYNIENVPLQHGIDIIYQNVVNEVAAQIIEEVVPQEDVEVVINENEDMTIS